MCCFAVATAGLNVFLLQVKKMDDAANSARFAVAGGCRVREEQKNYAAARSVFRQDIGTVRRATPASITTPTSDAGRQIGVPPPA